MLWSAVPSVTGEQDSFIHQQLISAADGPFGSWLQSLKEQNTESHQNHRLTHHEEEEEEEETNAAIHCETEVDSFESVFLTFTFSASVGENMDARSKRMHARQSL